MRKLLLLLAVMAIGMVATAQIGAVKSLTIGDLWKDSTFYSGVATVSGQYNAVTFQALCEQLDGTSDGTLRLEGSVDGITYKTINEKDGYAMFEPNDTLTIVDDATWNAVIFNAPFKYYRVAGLGTDNDSTAVTIKYILK